MSGIILHHYDLSSFSEKIRLALGYKGLAWNSVKVEPMPPRPLLDALTGGYRRIPVLQIGADIYCDTEMIFAALERVKPDPSLYPAGEGIAKALSLWWDRTTWKPMIGILVQYVGQDMSEAFLKDRKDGYLGYDISKQAMAPMLPAYVQQMAACAEWLASMLAENGRYLTGGKLSAADLSCYHTLRLLRFKAGAAEIDRLLRLAPLTSWMERIAAVGYGTITDMTAEQAFEAAGSAEPAAADYLRGGDPSGIAPGTAVKVTPDDNARIPVKGVVVAADAQEIVIRREHPRAGNIHVHFPRAGYETIPI